MILILIQTKQFSVDVTCYWDLLLLMLRLSLALGFRVEGAGLGGLAVLVVSSDWVSGSSVCTWPSHSSGGFSTAEHSQQYLIPCDDSISVYLSTRITWCNYCGYCQQKYQYSIYRRYLPLRYTVFRIPPYAKAIFMFEKTSLVNEKSIWLKIPRGLSRVTSTLEAKSYPAFLIFFWHLWNKLKLHRKPPTNFNEIFSTINWIVQLSTVNQCNS